MGIEENKEIVSRVMREAWTKGNLGNLDEFFNDNFVEHNPYGTVEGIDGIRQFVDAVRKTYSNFRVVPDNFVADDNLVACTFVVEGKHTEEVGDLAPTDNEIRIDGTYLARIEEGKIAEAWNNFDLTNLLIQLGQMSPPSFVETREEQVSTKARRESPEYRPRP